MKIIPLKPEKKYTLNQGIDDLANTLSHKSDALKKRASSVNLKAIADSPKRNYQVIMKQRKALNRKAYRLRLLSEQFNEGFTSDQVKRIQQAIKLEFLPGRRRKKVEESEKNEFKMAEAIKIALRNEEKANPNFDKNFGVSTIGTNNKKKKITEYSLQEREKIAKGKKDILIKYFTINPLTGFYAPKEKIKTQEGEFEVIVTSEKPIEKTKGRPSKKK